MCWEILQILCSQPCKKKKKKENCQNSDVTPTLGYPVRHIFFFLAFHPFGATVL
jgi:hypothetical protein